MRVLHFDMASLSDPLSDAWPRWRELLERLRGMK
jgi:hypothetical protein